MTFLCCGELEELDGVFQNGEAELYARVSTGSLHAPRRSSDVRGAVCEEGRDLLAVSDAMTLVVVWTGTNQPGPFPGVLVSKSTAIVDMSRIQTCCCFFADMVKMVELTPRCLLRSHTSTCGASACQARSFTSALSVLISSRRRPRVRLFTTNQSFDYRAHWARQQPFLLRSIYSLFHSFISFVR